MAVKIKVFRTRLATEALKFHCCCCAQSNIPTLLYSPWEKYERQGSIQRSKFPNLRCQTVCQCCKYYLRYWSQSISRPKDTKGVKNFQSFIKWEGLTGHEGSIEIPNQLYMLNQYSEPFSRPTASSKTNCLYIKTESFDPLEGLEVYLFLGINILGNIYHVDRLFATSDWGFLPFQ